MKKPYQLSVWDGEEFLKIIGDSGSLSPQMAYDAVLKATSKTTGDTLTFSMMYNFTDSSGNKIYNDLINYIVAEGKLKLKILKDENVQDSNYFNFLEMPTDLLSEDTNNKTNEIDLDNMWFEFTINTIDQDPHKNILKITAISTYQKELSKAGYGVTYDIELQNNFGNLQNLAERAVEDTDWMINPNSYKPVATATEPIFPFQVCNATNASLTVKIIINGDVKEQECDISNDTLIYIPYSVMNKAKSNENKGLVTLSSGMDFMILSEEDFNDITINGTINDITFHCWRQIIKFINGEDETLAAMAQPYTHQIYYNRPTFPQETMCEKVTGKYVKKWKSNINTDINGYIDNLAFEIQHKEDVPSFQITSDTPIYSYPETTYVTTSLLKNYAEVHTVLGGSENAYAWIGEGTDNQGRFKNYKVECTVFPQSFYKYGSVLRDANSTWLQSNLPIFKTGIKLNFKGGVTYYNTTPNLLGLVLTQGKKYVLRYKGRWVRDKEPDFSKYDETKLTTDRRKLCAAIREECCQNVFTGKKYTLPTINVGIVQKKGKNYEDCCISVPFYFNKVTNLNDNETTEDGDDSLDKYLQRGTIQRSAIDNMTDNEIPNMEKDLLELLNERGYAKHSQNRKRYTIAETAEETDLEGLDIDFTKHPLLDKDFYEDIDDPNTILMDKSGYFYTFLQANITTTEKQTLYLKFACSFDEENTTDKWFFFLEDLQLFEYVEVTNKNGEVVPVFLDDTPEGYVRTEEHFYILSGNEEDHLRFPVYFEPNLDTLEPILTMQPTLTYSAKQQNALTHIQKISELFNVTPIFNIIHDKKGRIMKVDNDNHLYSADTQDTDDETFRLAKYITFIPKENFLEARPVLRYGVDLKTITRTIDTKDLVTDLYITTMTQSAAEGGVVSIVNVDENLTGTNEIFNFDYYYNQGLLSSQDMLDLGELQKQLKEYSLEIHSRSDNLIVVNKTILESEADYKVAQELDIQLEEKLGDIVASIDALIEGNADADITNEEYQYVYFSSEQIKTQNKINYLSSKLEKLYEEQSTLLTEIKELQDESSNTRKKGLQKFLPYIREGNWSDSTKLDNKEYYYAAIKRSQELSFPKVTYKFSTQTTPEKAFSYLPGDLVYIIDPEIFGSHSTYIEELNIDVITPNQKSAIITDVTLNLNSPSKNTFTVQTFNDRFSEVFSTVIDGVYDYLQNREQFLNIVGTSQLETVDINSHEKSLLQQLADRY